MNVHAKTVTSARHRVVTLVRHGVMPMELGIVHQMFRQARSASGDPLYDVTTCAPSAGLVRTDADFRVEVHHGPEALAQADTVLVPASHEVDETETDGTLGPELAAAWAHIRPRTRIASICTGAFVLAAAGLLDGHRATTHWKSADHLRRLHPRVRVDADVLYVDEGDVLTSAGEAAGIDLCLHLIRRDHGSAVANDVARATVVPPHRDGGQAQFIPHPIPEPHGPSTAAARAWALAHLDDQVTLRDMARQEATSTRAFSRKFRQETGTSPMQWLTLQRVERARQLLEETDMTVERIASQVGFGTSVSLRQHLLARLGVTPSAYRATFRGPASTPTSPHLGSH
ncbi:GlxA family transcriptional regulator [Streptomyces sp. NPDC020883]|uniref:GlxA family transcriptional regulator n=1 Tax=Streptomyces sp. NPDC020883 TaxID=3365099 RepID=UPI0037A53546